MILIKYLILFLFLPFAVFSQQNKFWITTIADIEFSNNKIVYRFSKDMPVNFSRIIPLFYPADLLKICPITGIGYLENNDFQKLKNQIDDYIENWSVQYANNREELMFLKFCCLKIIWNTGTKQSLPENAINVLQILKNDLDIEISKNTKLVIRLYNEMKN